MELLQDIERLLAVPFSVWKTEFDLQLLKKLAPIGDVPQLLANIFVKEAESYGKSLLFIKENHLYEFYFFLCTHYPNARYVYLVRDPRDMALSWKCHSSHPGGILNAAEQWQKDQQNSLKIFNELYKSGQGLFVKYEKLIEETCSELSRIISFLGEEYYPEIINEFAEDELTIKNSETNEAWKNLSAGVIKNNSGKYKKFLTEKEIRIIEKICFTEMRFLGYEPDFSVKDLEQVSPADICEYRMMEAENIQYARSEGVRLNMEAKKIFYKKFIEPAEYV
jgi:hypothetical protein